jgi:hypothetical protein
MKLKEIIIAVLVLVATFGYGYLQNVLPDFPLEKEKFISLVTWGVGLFFAGWQLKKQVLVKKMMLRSFALGRSIDPQTWKPLLKAGVLLILPILFNAIIGWNASFPLSLADFTAVILYLIGIPIGGWLTATSTYKSQGRIVE